MPILPKILKEKVSDAWINWFRYNRDALDAMNKDDPSVLFTLKPEALDDRDYNLSEETFGRFLRRTFGMTEERRQEYEAFKNDGEYLAVPSDAKPGVNIIVRNDIGYRVERIMKKMGRDSAAILEYKKVTVEEIDDTLVIIAAQNKGSSYSVRSLAQPGDKCLMERLEGIYSRLQGSQAKWLTRIIYKDFGFKVPEDIIVSAFYTSFPRILKVTAKFDWKDLIPIRRDGETGIIMGRAPPKTSEDTASSSKGKSISGSSVVQPEKSLQLVSPPATRPSLLSESKASSLNVTKRPTQQLLPNNSNRVESPKQSSARHRQKSPQKSPQKAPRKSPHKSPQKSPSPRPPTTNIFTGTGKCQQTPSCLFTNTIFILAPCISSFPFLTDHLLPSHGATYITSLQPLTRKLLPKRCPITGTRVRKIAVVESGRRDQMIAFLRRIENLHLTRANGKHDWIEVVDWRLLEKIRGVEGGGEVGDGVVGGVWRRYRVGVV
ncbi:hypothetical protein NHQ30_001133 [Ciborinia camelliae]|nr:hypothetical protein NHQ30_001133 [Ciborinia camelliae]